MPRYIEKFSHSAQPWKGFVVIARHFKAGNPDPATAVSFILAFAHFHE
jgi:hypothetical protein